MLAFVLDGPTDERSFALMLPAGALILAAAASVASGRAGTWPFRGRGAPQPSRLLRLVGAAMCALVGLGWTFGGVLGVLRILGLYEFPD